MFNMRAGGTVNWWWTRYESPTMRRGNVNTNVGPSTEQITDIERQQAASGRLIDMLRAIVVCIPPLIPLDAIVPLQSDRFQAIQDLKSRISTCLDL